MTWLVWRQHRYEILALLIASVAIFVALIYGADYAVRVRRELGVETCQPTPFTNAQCVTLSVQAGDRMQPFRWLVVALFFLPAIVGSFVGGPLFARDLERGTHRLVWTQSITRRRWAIAKLVALCAAGAAGAALVATAGHLGTTIMGTSQNAYQSFDIEGPAFVSYVLFGISVAAFVGTFSRRILTGMFLGLLLFGLFRVGISYGLRPNYEPPVTVTYSAATPCPQCEVPPQAWVVSNDYVDHTGSVVPQERVRELSDQFFYRSRPIGANDPVVYLAKNDALQRVRFHPQDRYWRFQWTEGLLFLLLSGAFALATLGLLTKRDA